MFICVLICKLLSKLRWLIAYLCGPADEWLAIMASAKGEVSKEGKGKAMHELRFIKSAFI